MECKKVKFACEQYADFHIAKHKLQNDIQGLKARSYKCLICQNSWHISSKVDSQKLLDDNSAMFLQLEEAKEMLKKQFKEIKALKHIISQKGRHDLKEEIVISSLEHILNAKTEQIQHLETKNKQLTNDKNQLIFKLNTKQANNEFQ